MAIALINANVSRNVLRPIGFIHDAIVCIAPEAKAKEACAAIKYWMEHIPLKQWFGFTPPIPIIAEASVGKNLSKMIELENDWYKDDGIKSWFDIQTAQYEHDHAKWKKDCAEAKKAGKNLPDEPKKPVAQPRRKLTIQRTVTPPPKPARPRLVLKRRA
jgi:hypothetical protein